MVRPKARRTKSTTIQARMEDNVKKILQRYADSQGITLSALVQRTLANLADVVKAQQQQ
jgi:predicted HicB family RNase H-like nuclease